MAALSLNVLAEVSKVAALSHGLVELSQTAELIRHNAYSAPVLSCMGFLYVTEQMNNSNLSQIKELFLTAPFFALIDELVRGAPQKKTNVSKFEDIRKIEGSCYGCLTLAFNDPLVFFLQKLVCKLQQQKDSAGLQEVQALMIESKLDESIVGMLQQLSPSYELTPRGLVHLLILLTDLVQFKQVAQRLFLEEDNLLSILAIIKESQISALLEWPQAQGGGPTCVNLICLQVFKLLNLLFLKNQTEKELSRILSTLSQQEVVLNVLTQFNSIPTDNIYTAISLLSKLVLHNSDSQPFAQ